MCWCGLAAGDAAGDGCDSTGVCTWGGIGDGEAAGDGAGLPCWCWAKTVEGARASASRAKPGKDFDENVITITFPQTVKNWARSESAPRPSRNAQRSGDYGFSAFMVFMCFMLPESPQQQHSCLSEAAVAVVAVAFAPSFFII